MLRDFSCVVLILYCVGFSLNDVLIVIHLILQIRRQDPGSTCTGDDVSFPKWQVKQTIIQMGVKLAC